MKHCSYDTNTNKNLIQMRIPFYKYERDETCVMVGVWEIEYLKLCNRFDIHVNCECICKNERAFHVDVFNIGIEKDNHTHIIKNNILLI